MSEDRLIELERADAARIVLEEAAVRLESYSANVAYQQALKRGAKILRDMKEEINKLIIANEGDAAHVEDGR